MYAPNGKSHSRPLSASYQTVVSLNRLFAPHEQLDCLLQNAAEVLVENLGLQFCVITWLAADQVSMRVRAQSSGNGTAAHIEDDSIVAPLDYPNSHTDEPLLAREQARYYETGAAPKLTVPLKVHHQIVGHVCVTPRDRHKPIATEHLDAFCETISRAIELTQMRQMLASRYAAAAAQKAARTESGAGHTLDACMLQIAQNPEYVAKIIARSFYKDLRKAGFAAKQILLIASEIIGHLGEAFHKTKIKMK